MGASRDPPWGAKTGLSSAERFAGLMKAMLQGLEALLELNWLGGIKEKRKNKKDSPEPPRLSPQTLPVRRAT